MARGRNFNLIVGFIVAFVFLFALLPLYFLGIQASKRSKRASTIVKERFASYLDSLHYYSIQLINDGDNNDLDDTIMPDHSKVLELGGRSFNIFWNIAENKPTYNMKSIKIFVFPVGGGKKDTITVVKQKPSE
ncbi:MAG: hypothetical protein ACPL6C_00775 [bacterium]